MAYNDIKKKDKYINEKDCPFCGLHKSQLLRNYGNFVLIENKYPYCENHTMLTPTFHCTDIREMKADDCVRWDSLLRHVERMYLKRFGSCFTLRRQFTTGQSVAHVHQHFMPYDDWIKDVERLEKPVITF